MILSKDPQSSPVEFIENDRCALQVQQLSAGYAGHRQAIHDVSFTVNRGERLAVIGPNGAGKSTLFKALAGIIPHTSGNVSTYGLDCRTSHTLIGYVPQYEEVDWQFPATVFDVVMMGRIRKIGWLRFPRKVDRDGVYSTLEQVGMAHLSNRQIGQLSGGQKRRVFIARALVQETDIILLDEPFSGVDVNAEDEIMETLEHLNRTGITIILSTHDLQTASTRFDRLMLINQQLIAIGKPEDVFTPSNLRQAYGGAVSVFQQGNEMLIFSDEHDHA
ncbi:MAG: metal ABC transporter ATP-binding protein [Aggregatilineales bacterium]